MRSAWFRRLGLAAIAGWLSVAGIAAGGTGCAGTREEINRVQADAIRKSDLVGDFHNGKDAPEWYMRSLILEVQRTNPWFSDGLQDLTRRIRFEVTENYLIARDAYEYIQNSDGHGGPRGKTNNGAPVGMWRIRSHFDIQPGYNPATGEKTNVLEENQTDRRWYEREYMRVDWSANLIDDPNTIYFWEKFAGELRMAPVPFYESDPKNKLASHLEELPNGYLEITSKWLASPMTTDYYGYQVPYCLLHNMRLYPETASSGTDPCNDQEVTIRTSFAKVPTGADSTDYEVAEVSPADGDVVGTINLQRSGYDREYGIIDQTWHTYIQRYNVWKKSHDGRACGENNVKADGDATCANGEAISNSVCDMNVKQCTIPYENREVRPVVWYADPEAPASLFATTADAVGQWNSAFMAGIGYAREAECRRLGGAREDCHGKYFKSATIDPKVADEPLPINGPAVVYCHNPVVKGDDPSCGKEGFSVRKGDIRHHMVAWWNNPSWERPLGVVVPGGDPLTGEEVGSIVNFFGASLETYTATFRDYVQLINGDISPSEYASGLPSQLFSGDDVNILQNDPTRDPALDSLAASYQKGPNTWGMSSAEVKARAGAVDIAGARARIGMPKATGANDAERMAHAQKFLANQGALGRPGFGGAQEHDARLSAQVAAMQAGGLEQKVANSQWFQTAGADSALATSKVGLDDLSPLRGASLDYANDLAKAEHPRLSEGGACTLKIEDMGLRFEWLAGVGAKFKARYPDGAVASGPMADRAGVSGKTIDRVVRGKLIYQELLEPMYEFTILHEMGHLVSLEHDFSGSWDAPNYYTEYWTLRAGGNKANMKACNTGDDPKTCVGPRWLDPITTDELGTTKGSEHDSINDYAVSSVMDYKFDSVYAARLAPFDQMAAKYIYGRVVETFDDTANSLVGASQKSAFKWALPLQNSERWLVSGNYAHYTEIARSLNLFDPGRCRPQTAEEKARGVGAVGLVCQLPHKDHVLVRDMDDTVVYDSGDGFVLKAFKGQEHGGSKRVRWPYKVGDGNLSYVHQYYYDDGADFYEITRDALERYDLYYLDYFYRKNRRERTPLNAGRGMEARFFGRIQELQWNALSDAVRNGGEFDPTATADIETTARTLAITLLFDGMQNAILRPQPGSYTAQTAIGQTNTIFGVPASGTVATPAFKVGVGDARYIDNQYDLTKGYDYQAYIIRSGTYLEKPYAAIALTDSRPQLSTVARETYLDGRNVMFNFRDAVPRAFDRLIAGAMANDLDTVAPYVLSTDTPDALGNLPLHTLHLWDETNGLNRPAGAKVVDPMFAFRAQVPAMYLMLLFEPINTNMELVNRTRIWIDGSKEAISIPDSEKVAFFDPENGVQWTARSFGRETLSGKIVDVGIGARMLEHANELLVKAYGLDTETYPGATTQTRAKYNASFRPTVTVGGVTRVVTAADVKDPIAAAELRKYVGFLNDTRLLLYYLGFGPCGRGEFC